MDASSLGCSSRASVACSSALCNRCSDVIMNGSLCSIAAVEIARLFKSQRSRRRSKRPVVPTNGRQARLLELGARSGKCGFRGLVSGCAGVPRQAYRMNDATKKNLNRVPWAFAEMFSLHPVDARLES